MLTLGSLFDGAVIRARANYILQDVDGLEDDYCILSFTKLYATFPEEEDSL